MILCNCCCSVANSCPTPCDPMDCSMPDSSVLHYLLEFAQTHIHWVCDALYLIICYSLLLLPSIFPNVKVFSNELALMQRAKVLKTGCISWFSETFLTLAPVVLPFLYPIPALKTSSSLCLWQLLLPLTGSAQFLPSPSSSFFLGYHFLTEGLLAYPSANWVLPSPVLLSCFFFFFSCDPYLHVIFYIFTFCHDIYFFLVVIFVTSPEWEPCKSVITVIKRLLLFSVLYFVTHQPEIVMAQK